MFDTAIAAATAAYFKSTDFTFTNQQNKAFFLRLQLPEVVERNVHALMFEMTWN